MRKVSGLFERSWKLGVAVGLITTLLAKITPYIPAINIQMATINVREQALRGIDVSFTQKVLNFLSGYITLPALLITIITGILLVMIGNLIFDFASNMGLKVRNIYEKTTLVLLFGWLVLLFLAQWSLKLPSWTVIAAVAIYFLITTVIIVYGAKLLKINLEY